MYIEMKKNVNKSIIINLFINLISNNQNQHPIFICRIHPTILE